MNWIATGSSLGFIFSLGGGEPHLCTWAMNYPGLPWEGDCSATLVGRGVGESRVPPFAGSKPERLANIVGGELLILAFEWGAVRG